jgi:hypothetical protein
VLSSDLKEKERVWWMVVGTLFVVGDGAGVAGCGDRGVGDGKNGG